MIAELYLDPVTINNRKKKEEENASTINIM